VSLATPPPRHINPETGGRNEVLKIKELCELCAM